MPARHRIAAAALPIVIALCAVSCDKSDRIAHAPPQQPESPVPPVPPAPAQPAQAAQQPPSEWRNHPLLKGRFHKEHPDDLQVFIHDGGPRIATATPELAWVQVSARGEGDIFKGTVLNKPFHLAKVKEGDAIRFMIKPGWKQPVQVRDNYLQERAAWTIKGCDKCGFDELFDAPSELIKLANAPETARPVEIASACPMCGGMQVVKSKGAR